MFSHSRSQVGRTTISDALTICVAAKCAANCFKVSRPSMIVPMMVAPVYHDVATPIGAMYDVHV